MQFLRQDETLSLSFASLVMVDYTYKYNIQDLFIEEVHSYSPKKLMYTNSLVNADSFYANFTSTTFQKIPIPHSTSTKKQIFLQ